MSDESMLSPILIGSTLSQNASGTSVYCPEDDSLYSVDNVRLELSSNPNDFQSLSLQLDMLFDDVDFYSGSNRIGTYRFFWAWRFETFSMALGYGLNSVSGCDLGKGFFEFNPNKVPCSYWGSVLDLLRGFSVSSRLVRWDLAIDYAVPRDSVRLIKDGRNYECVISSSFTEYLGQRSHSGRVKVYDKQIESSLNFPCTRVELTCSFSWSSSDVLRHLPIVFSLSSSSFPSLSGVTRAFALAVYSICRSGDSLEPWLRLVSAKTKTKIRSAFSSGFCLPFSRPCVERVLSDLEKYSV